MLDLQPFVKKGVFTISWTGGAQTFDFMNGQILPKQCGGQHCVDILLVEQPGPENKGFVQPKS